MAIGIVDRFEMVDIGHQHRQRQGVAAALGEIRGEGVEDAAAIGDLGQFVGARAFLQRLAQRDHLEMVAGGDALAAIDAEGHPANHRRLGHGGGDQHAARLYKGMQEEIGQHHAADAARADQRHAQKGGRGGQDEGHADGDDHQAQIEERRQRPLVEQEQGGAPAQTEQQRQHSLAVQQRLDAAPLDGARHRHIA